MGVIWSAPLARSKAPQVFLPSFKMGHLGEEKEADERINQWETVKSSSEPGINAGSGIERRRGK